MRSFESPCSVETSTHLPLQETAPNPAAPAEKKRLASHAKKRTIAASECIRGPAVQRERWVRLEQLFAQAMKRAPAERETWLARACGDDAEMFREVVELLRADATPGMLDTFPFAGERAAAVIGGSLSAGTQGGSWRIEKLVGRGGMGEVYAAMRADTEFTQRGALKLLRFEAIGELARFH